MNTPDANDLEAIRRMHFRQTGQRGITNARAALNRTINNRKGDTMRSIRLNRADIPATFEVQPLADTTGAVDPATCGSCGLTWDDGISTSLTPAPSARCPFEYFHQYDDTDIRPILDLSFTTGRFCIGATDLDDNGMGVRSYSLATQEPGTANNVMLRRFEDLVRLCGDNVQVRRDTFDCEEDAMDEADARNAADPELGDTNQAWQVACVGGNSAIDCTLWTVTIGNTEE